MPRKNPHIGEESPGEYARRRGARDPEFATAFEEEFDKLRLAGVKTSLWPPFEQGLLWRYRRENWLRLL